MEPRERLGGAQGGDEHDGHGGLRERDGRTSTHSLDEPRRRGSPRTTRRTIDFNVKWTTRKLGVHTSMVYFRLNRLKTISSSDSRTYRRASTILTALRLLEIQCNAKRR
jgi:hypothetical protein